MKELIIIGGGPAGITAAIYAARKKMDFVMVTRDIGGQAAWSGDIENFTGFQFIPGPELAMKFREHLEKYKFDLREGIEVTKAEQIPGGFKVTLAKGEALEATTLIVASGKRSRLLNVPGEAKFKSKGLAYCAICDGPLFAGKNTAVIGSGNSGLDAVLSLMKICPQVYLVSHTKDLAGDAIMQEKIKAAENVEILYNTKVTAVFGQQFVEGIKIEQDGQARDLAVSGVFVEIGLVPNSNFIDFVKKNEKNEIEIDCSARTSVDGVFAAGDVTRVPAKQIVVAAGDGAKATLSAFDYLSRH